MYENVPYDMCIQQSNQSLPYTSIIFYSFQ